MNIDSKNLTGMDKRLIQTITLLGVTAQQASKAFQDLGKTIDYMKPNIRKMNWRRKTRPWR